MQRDDFDVRRFPGIDAVGLSEAGSSLRVAIVTEEIIGPVRNGGIASTYYHLAKGLAAQGHEVHVLFLKGPVVQDETPEHWVQKYAAEAANIAFVGNGAGRSEEHTSELQPLMRTSYAAFSMQKKPT